MVFDVSDLMLAPTRDHVEPTARAGGSPTLMTCRRCNEEKDKESLHAWLQRLETVSDPRAPFVRQVHSDLRSGRATIIGDIVTLPMRPPGYAGMASNAKEAARIAKRIEKLRRDHYEA